MGPEEKEWGIACANLCVSREPQNLRRVLPLLVHAPQGKTFVHLCSILYIIMADEPLSSQPSHETFLTNPIVVCNARLILVD
jgi:hypothetical protein